MLDNDIMILSALMSSESMLALGNSLKIMVQTFATSLQASRTPKKYARALTVLQIRDLALVSCGSETKVALQTCLVVHAF